MNEISPDLPLTSGWSLGEEALAALVADVAGLKPQQIVEFGSGPSSLRLALAFPEAHVFTVDDSPEFGGKTRQLVEAHGLGARVQVNIRPLTWQWWKGALYQSYEPGAFPDQVDAILVDGPPSATRRGREACLHMVVDQLRVGGRVYLDDHRRPAERRIGRNWQASFPGLREVGRLRVGHELLVLEKTQAFSGGRFRSSVFADVAAANLRRLLGVAARRLVGKAP